MKHCFRTVMLGLAGALAASAASATEPGAIPAVSGTVIFSGSDYKESSSYSYIGGAHAFNGNLGTDGFLIRLFGGLGNYDYDNGTVPGGNVDTDLSQFDVTLGYQVYGSGLRFTAYAGASYEDHDRSPEDPANVVQGDEWGFKGILEVETLANSPIYFGALGHYSTGFDEYWARGRVGANLGNGIAVGPEIIGLGNEGFDQVRYGAFVSGLPSFMSLIFGGDGKMSASVGWADSKNDGNGQGGDDSVYGTFGSSFTF